MSFHFQIFTVPKNRNGVRYWQNSAENRGVRWGTLPFPVSEEVHQLRSVWEYLDKTFLMGAEMGPLSAGYLHWGGGGGVKRATSKLENKNQIGIGLSH